LKTGINALNTSVLKYIYKKCYVPNASYEMSATHSNKLIHKVTYMQVSTLMTGLALSWDATMQQLLLFLEKMETE
jgi:hypothetical protein